MRTQKLKGKCTRPRSHRLILILKLSLCYQNTVNYSEYYCCRGFGYTQTHTFGVCVYCKKRINERPNDCSESENDRK